MDFEEWIAGVESEIASDVDPEAYRQYFDDGLTPVEAVMQSRVDDGA